MNFPKELAALPQWICWRLEPDPKSEKPRKVPYDPKTGRKASSTNPQTWATLAEAEAARQKYLFTGVGFVFTEAGGVVGVDIDHCRDENGEFNETAKSILTKYPSYTEISPSGTGLHIFYRGAMPGKGNKNSQSAVEMYAAARYFTMTGNRLEGRSHGFPDGRAGIGKGRLSPEWRGIYHPVGRPMAGEIRQPVRGRPGLVLRAGLLDGQEQGADG